MLRPGGYTFETDLDGHVSEGESYTCKHCNKVVFVKPFERPEDIGGRCTCCNGLMCLECTGKQRCDPLEAKLERWERYGMGV